jgi:transcriptional regulator with XRE-family HTH domain
LGFVYQVVAALRRRAVTLYSLAGSIDSRYAIKMTQAAELLRDARKRADLSMRGLAIRADVAYTTVQRIEQGSMDPTVGMLSKLLAAMGEELQLGCVAVFTPELAKLTDAWHTTDSSQDWPDWTRLRTFLDYLHMNPHLCGPATLRQPPPSGSVVMDNFLAAIAEKICDDAQLPRPTWTNKVPGLHQEWVGLLTPRMRAVAVAATPIQFMQRNIIMNINSLWREKHANG